MINEPRKTETSEGIYIIIFVFSRQLLKGYIYIRSSSLTIYQIIAMYLINYFLSAVSTESREQFESKQSWSSEIIESLGIGESGLSLN